MEIEELEVFDFLKKTTPLDKASDEQLTAVILHTKSFYCKRGSVLSVTYDNLYLIHQGAVSVVNDNEQIIEILDEQDWFGFDINLLDNQHICKEDTLFYIVNKKEFFNIFPDGVINNFFITNLNYNTVTENYQDNLLQNSVLTMSKALDVITTTKDATIASVAKIMTDNNTTAVLVVDDKKKLKGIITDRAFCTKVVAKTIDYNNKVAEILTSNPITIEHYENGINAMLKMAKFNIRHLPIMRNNKIIGLITAADLLRKQSHNVVFLLGEINQAKNIKELSVVIKHLPLLLVSSVANNFDEHDIAYSISTIGKAVIVKLIKQFEHKHGQPPNEYAFVVAGSMARSEQILNTDQDNLIILSDNYNKKNAKYFINLAKYVSDGLDKCGYIYCPGDVMATNSKWCTTLNNWKGYFKKWITEPNPKSLLHASIFFDMKCVYGNNELLNDLKNHTLQLSKKNRIFLSHMAANANRYRPPIGIFRNFILEKNKLSNKVLNMKKKGITPIIDMVRVYAISYKVQKINTIDRLNSLIKVKGMSKSGANDLIEAYKFINYMRIKHQALQIQQKLTPDNYIEPIMISSLNKKHLKNAFKVVVDMQDAMQNSYQSTIL